MTAFTCLAALCITGVVVIDGDTIRLDAPGKDLRLRLWGISAPELHDAGGRASRDALSALVEGQTLACTLMDVDRYRRPVVRSSAARRSRCRVYLPRASAAPSVFILVPLAGRQLPRQ